MVTGTFTGMFACYLHEHPSHPVPHWSVFCCKSFCITSHEMGEVRRGEEQEQRDGGRMKKLCVVKNTGGCVCV